MEEITRVAVDAMGGDNAPLEIVKGAIEAIQENSKIKVYLVGKQDLVEAELSKYLYTAGMPDPDLIIRPSGEERISNFLLWQSAYSEFYFTDVLWPDFTPRDMVAAIAAYQKRDRRYGGVKK